MDPIVHLGLTTALLSGAGLMGYDTNIVIAAASVVGGIFLDGDKAIEIVANQVKAKKGEISDITARCRILHSIFAFPFGLALSLMVSSWLPFIAVLLHIFADSFFPSLKENGKNYPSHSRRKWIANPFSSKSWAKVTIGWPVTRAAETNWVYDILGPIVGIILLLLSFLIYVN